MLASLNDSATFTNLLFAHSCVPRKALPIVCPTDPRPVSHKPLVIDRRHRSCLGAYLPSKR